MTRFRFFKRTWWADDACTVPEVGAKRYVRMSWRTAHITDEDAASERCRAYNRSHYGPTMRGARGDCLEYEPC